MTARTPVIVAGAIIALGVGAVALVLVATGPWSTASRYEVEAGATASNDVSVSAPAPTWGVPPAQPLAAGIAPPTVPSPVVESEEPRTVQLPPRALAGLAAPVAPCLRGGGLAGTSPTVLAIRLRTVPGGAEVVGAEVASSGGADASLVACARDAVRGARLEVPGFPTGELLAATWEVGAVPASAATFPGRSASSQAPPRVFHRQRGK